MSVKRLAGSRIECSSSVKTCEIGDEPRVGGDEVGQTQECEADEHTHDVPVRALEGVDWWEFHVRWSPTSPKSVHRPRRAVDRHRVVNDRAAGAVGPAGMAEWVPSREGGNSEAGWTEQRVDPACRPGRTGSCAERVGVMRRG